MRESTPSDAELLADWLGHQRESAFQELVARYAGLVHMAAKRTCGDETLAAEASQMAFILLARKAKSLASRSSLAGWLHLTAVMQAKNLIRKSRRETRKRQLLHAAMETDTPGHSGDLWKEMRPLLDEALASLSDKDREALLLRFYRSLSIREIAATLGIATDAAQKRLDRATERLRGKLARGGCQAGGSLSVAMLAGFAVDAQAAVPSVSLLASKAMAAGLASTSTLTSIAALITTTALKTTSFIPPAVALVLAGAWIGTHRQSLHALEKESALLESRIAERSAIAAADPDPVKPPATGKQEDGKKPIDWKEVAARIAERKSIGVPDDMSMDSIRFQQRLGSMWKEELVAALKEIGALDLSKESREELENLVMYPLVMKHPEYALAQLGDRLQDSNGIFSSYLSDAFGRWAKKDLEKAAGWMDQQIAAGNFESTSLDGKSWIRNRYEGILISTLLGSDPGAAASRLGALPEDRRGEVLFEEIGKKDQLAFAKLVRDHLSEKDQITAFGRQSWQLASEGYPEVAGYLDRIEATPEERVVCVEQAVISRIGYLLINHKIRPDDYDAMWEWAGTQAPGSAARVTGKALGAQIRYTLGFAAAAAIAVQYHETSGNDDVLVSFLECEDSRSHKEEARLLAEKISDGNRRAEILKSLQEYQRIK